jgi:hypothetical protein
MAGSTLGSFLFFRRPTLIELKSKKASKIIHLPFLVLETIFQREPDPRLPVRLALQDLYVDPRIASPNFCL